MKQTPKILFLSFYFYPDITAGSFRSDSLVEELKKKEVLIDVLTTHPNRYSSFVNSQSKDLEVEGNVTIRRIKIPSHSSGIFDQSFSYIYYLFGVLRYVRTKEYDLVYATSGRLFTAFLGSIISRFKGIPLYLDIRDIFKEVIGDILSPGKSLLIKPILSIVESFTYNSATKINIVSPGFKNYFRKIVPSKPLSLFTNGIDKEFTSANFKYDVIGKPSPLRMNYAWNIGESQGLEKILPNFLQELKDKIEIKVVGDGGQRKALERRIKNLKNISIENPIPRKDLIEYYKQSDVLFIHLNEHIAFKYVIPSKLFEYAATGRPILAGVSGFTSEFIKQELDNVAVFKPGDISGALNAFEELNFCWTDRSRFIEKFSRQKVMHLMTDDILRTI